MNVENVSSNGRDTPRAFSAYGEPMNRLIVVLVIVAASRCATAPASSVHSPQPRADWSTVEAVLGRSGSAQPGNVYKFGFPHGDLDVRIGDLRLKPALALGSLGGIHGHGRRSDDGHGRSRAHRG